jgi:putative flippase GtrA
MTCGAAPETLPRASSASLAPVSVSSRTNAALRRRANWVQLAQFGAVGVTGYVINLLVYTALLGWGAHIAAAISFVVAAASNYWWNRHWTFSHQQGNFGAQGARFLVVSLVAFAVNQLWLVLFIDVLDWRKVLSQAIAIILVTPLNFLGNKLWSFRK